MWQAQLIQAETLIVKALANVASSFVKNYMVNHFSYCHYKSNRYTCESIILATWQINYQIM